MSIDLVVGVMLFLLGLPITYWLGRRTRQKSDLRYAVDFDEVLVPDPSLLNEGLSLKFDGHEIERLCRTYIAVWNHRGDALRSEDLTQHDPLRVEVSGGDTILQLRIVSRSRSQNSFSIGHEGGSGSVRTLTFDFLDARDGVVLEVLHRVPSSARIHGTLRGGGIKFSGWTELAPNARGALTGSWWRRYRSSPDSSKTADLVMALNFLLTVSVLGFLGGSLVKVPHLVDISRFDVSSLEGQRALSREISNSGNSSMKGILFWCLVGIGVLSLLYFAFRFFRIARRAIPREILREAFDEIQGDLFRSGSAQLSKVKPVSQKPLGPLGVSSSDLVRGTRVRHVNFGVGRVLSVEGAGSKAIAEVHFEEVGRKRLLLRVAPLQLLL